MRLKINHIGIAVKSIDEAKKVYELIGASVEHIEVVEEQKVKVAFIPFGETNIELLEATSEDSPIAKFIKSRGEGIHHIAIEVENIEETIVSLKENGIKLIDEKPRVGARGMKIAFLHPKTTNGVLIELCQKG